MNGRKPLNSIVFYDYQASLSISKLRYPDEMTHLTFMPEFPLKLPFSYEWFCSIRGRINLGHIPYLFINFADFRFGQ